ncbi:hypothetical protein [Aeromonas dhakensis]|uniref:hypothetical protein n=1 Tax=Aeromonas dhakensis TaxID=196024 RepID=UPI00191F5C35|nr:hypothetical protein [Aeromonas dhakensis]MBL0679815.1 hypothetical protein [Aeromonas dhakensis]
MIYVPVMLVVAPLVFILLPPIERTTSGSWGLGQALLLILGALARVELTLAQAQAQALQYVLGNTPLQAGMFIIPIMAAAAVGGPNAGYLFNLCSLRTVASSSLAISAAATLLSDLGGLSPSQCQDASNAGPAGTLSQHRSDGFLHCQHGRSGGGQRCREATVYESGARFGSTF